MTSHYITSWQIHGETLKTVTSFIFLGSKITGGSDCSCEKRDADPWNKAMTNLDSILKSSDIALPAKVCTVKAVVLPEVVMNVRFGP